MATIALGLRLLLAGVFLAAGIGKLLDLQGSRRAMRDFGLPDRAAGVAGTVLPFVELAAGLALIFRPTARWGALLALLLLAAFIVGIGRALARGEQPDCHCFGQIHSAPAGRVTLARNAVLAAFAAVVVAYGSGPAVDTWVSARSPAELVAIGLGIFAVAAAAYAFKLRLNVQGLTRELRLARQSAAVASRFGLPVGIPAPPFALEDLRGGTATLDDLLARGQPVLLMFMSPWCGPCGELLPSVQQWQQGLRERLSIAILSTGTAEQNAEFDEAGIEDVLLQDEMQVADIYHVTGTPTAVLVSSEGKIASNKAEQAQAIEPLVRLALRKGGDVPLEGSVA